VREALVYEHINKNVRAYVAFSKKIFDIIIKVSIFSGTYVKMVERILVALGSV
jgi:hypothetical protein